jgi:hypothetical protein
MRAFTAAGPGLIRRHGGLLLGEGATGFRYGQSGGRSAGTAAGPEPAR